MREITTEFTKILKEESSREPNFLEKSKQGTNQSLGTGGDPLGGVPGGAGPCISVAIGGNVCATGAGGVADAAVGTCVADTTSGVVADALFVIACAAPLRTAEGNEVASGDTTTLEGPGVAGAAARESAGDTGFIDTGTCRPGVL